MAFIEINTTQNVPISLQAAPISARIVAFLLDSVIQGAYIGTLLLLATTTGIFENAPEALSITITVILLMPVFLYALLCETFLQGQTPGKMIMKLRVVKIDGYALTFIDFFIRWVVMIFEITISGGIIALLSIFMSKRSQRLGDIAAGTGVIDLRKRHNLSHTILEEVEESYHVTFPQVTILKDKDIQIIKDTLEEVLKSKNYALLSKLRERVEAVTGAKAQMNDVDYLSRILKDYSSLSCNET